MLGLDSSDYPRFGDFKDKVITVCQEALANYTDISFTYESYGKKGSGGKVLTLMFTITSNQDFIDPLSLGSFISANESLEEDIDDTDITNNKSSYDSRISLFAEACENTFSRDEMKNLYALLLEEMPHIFHDDLKCYHYLSRKYHEMMMYDKKTGIKHRFKYMRKLIGTE
jgi:hypothetical protein